MGGGNYLEWPEHGRSWHLVSPKSFWNINFTWTGALVAWSGLLNMGALLQFFLSCLSSFSTLCRACAPRTPVNNVTVDCSNIDDVNVNDTLVLKDISMLFAEYPFWQLSDLQMSKLSHKWKEWGKGHFHLLRWPFPHSWFWIQTYP